MPTIPNRLRFLLAVLLSGFFPPLARASELPPPETRATWLTTTANTALSSPANTADSMRRLRAVGLNTVYIECWKNGYTQYPSQVLKRTIGLDRRPALMPQDPSDPTDAIQSEGRDLLAEAVLEAHRNGLLAIAWFEYGFMAAHKSTDNHLRTMKPEWLSKDIHGNTIAPNGFVWMNPLHPEPRRFLLDLVLEAIDHYDLDGIQLDDRIVWPYITMGYDDYTRAVYANEHMGKHPPADHHDPDWTRWRADKVNEYARQFANEVRARRPGILISLSPAVYPWVYDNYCLDWPKWAEWTFGQDTPRQAGVPDTLRQSHVLWDEFIPQVYRMSYAAFENTWLDQIKWMNQLGGGRVRDMLPGIRIVGDGPDATWDDLRRSIELARSTNAGGHVLWFSRGILDLYEQQLTDFYNVKHIGHAPHPKFPPDWRPIPTKLSPSPSPHTPESRLWHADAPPGDYVVSATQRGLRRVLHSISVPPGEQHPVQVALPIDCEDAELIRDRRSDLNRPR